MILFTSVLLLEASLRLLGLGDPVVLETAPSYQYFLKPNQNHFRFFVHTRTNKYGMRSGDFPAQKPAGTYRILFVGDSITYGTTRVDQDKLFTQILRRDLPALLHRPVEILNASASAWAIGNELGFVKSHGTFNADAVVLVLNDGDLAQRVSTAQDVGSNLFFEKPACAICELIHHFSKRPKEDAGTGRRPEGTKEEDENLQNLTEFRALVLKSGARMSILFVPFRKDLSNTNATVIQPKLAAWAKHSNVPILDATPLIGRLTISEASIDGGVHLSATGNSAVAASFEQAVRDSPDWNLSLE